MLSDDAKRAAPRSATVVLPARLPGTVRLEDDSSRVAASFALRDVRDAVATLGAGLVLYRGALDGADVVHRVHAEGTEDYVVFETHPSREELVYDLDVSRVPGLRLVSDTLEMLDETGTPRLRMAPPYVVDAAGVRHAAHTTVGGCNYDTDSSGPWGRPITAPQASRCEVHVRWESVEYPALVDPSWVATGSMVNPHASHTATLLGSGKVLIAGGEVGGTSQSTAELFDGVGTFAATGAMTAPRQRHTATLLASGKVLITGGFDWAQLGTHNGSLSSAELFDGSGSFAPTGSMTGFRVDHTATRLASGQVLIAGGSENSLLATAELFDGTASFSPTSSMGTGRSSFTATLLPSGKVLMASGFAQIPPTFATNSAELFDGTSTFAPTGSLSTGRSYHAASLTATGQVLITGGRSSNNPVSSSEVFDGVGTFTSGASMATPRWEHTTTLLDSGKILIFGGRVATGFRTSELWLGTFSPGPSLTFDRDNGTATLLPSGKVLAAGGDGTDGGSGMANGTAELLDLHPAGGTCLVDDDCVSGSCQEGICCATPCTGACRTCAPVTGVCGIVSNADDPDTCGGVNTCSATGVCLLRNGQSCGGGNTTCASGACSDGVCCDTACGGGVSTDCLACSLAAGGTTNGVCGPIANGSTCNDASVCTSSDTCQNGVCSGTPVVVCTAQDACHDVGVCDPTSGVCSNPASPDGTSCSDANSCTVSDTCQAGSCTAGSPVTCVALDECHDVGTCQTSGVCDDPVKANGTACSLGVCMAGVCTATSTSTSTASASSSSATTSTTSTTTASGQGGATSSGATTSGSGGSASSATAGGAGGGEDASGCSCRVPGSDGDTNGRAIAIGSVLLVIVAARRRKLLP